MTTVSEKPIVFPCKGCDLVGIVHDPGNGARRGVVIVVGGPQYRAGSHRLYVALGRTLAAAGIPALRFDYRGLGDSDGDYLGFEHLHDDIAAAIDTLMTDVPGLEEVVLWGLCDAASAILFYAPHDPRVTAVVLLNPWARSEATLARTYLRHYYPRRLVDRTFWRKLFRKGVNPVPIVKSLTGVVGQALTPHKQPTLPPPDSPVNSTTLMPVSSSDPRPLPERLVRSLRQYRGNVLLIMSGNDFTAQEFDLVMARTRGGRQLLSRPNITRQDIAAADHTFSSHEWRSRLIDLTRDWIARL